ncbi:unnamed protein product, partial [Owenia fusiformis]
TDFTILIIAHYWISTITILQKIYEKYDWKLLFINMGKVGHVFLMTWTLLLMCMSQAGRVKRQYPCILKRVDMLGCSTFMDLIHNTQFVFKALGAPGPLTLFVPSNEAFAALPDTTMDKLRSNVTYLTEIFSYHVVPTNAYFSRDFKTDVTYKTLLEPRRVRMYVYPRTKKQFYVTGSKLTSWDNDATNGVVHVIDEVMFKIPKENLQERIDDKHENSKANFSKLSELLTMAGPKLQTYLADDSPKTMFAPTNTAIERLPPGALYYWQHNKTALQEVLKYHVVKTTLLYVGLLSGSLETVEGSRINITQSTSRGVILNANSKPERGYNSAFLTFRNITVTNGVIHGIDSMLLPSPVPQRYVP